MEGDGGFAHGEWSQKRGGNTLTQSAAACLSGLERLCKLDAICAYLDCQPGDLLVHMAEPAADP
ncbi:helix-turn-helix transcriptional regulator [Pseudomonas sp. LAP_36]|nr:helix-turn-helix transcriptional regulator [Pseudomonas sp. LAP_36]MBW8136929.1 helix-turn-helix transcriptional regulator [Pseudomonas sp. PAMC 26818]